MRRQSRADDVHAQEGMTPRLFDGLPSLEKLESLRMSAAGIRLYSAASGGE